MSVPATTTDAALPAIPDDDDYGLGDLGGGATPRIKIDHKDAVFVDDLSGERFTELTSVVLGVVKNRSLWPAKMGDEKSKPLCRSRDGVAGAPNAETFPWAASGFTKNESLAEGVTQLLSCEACPLKEWGSHPHEDKPWCKEQFTLILMLPAGQGVAPALFTVQGSSIKPARKYLQSYRNASQPPFLAYTTIKLEALKRGTNVYAVPEFTKGPATDVTLHDVFRDNFRRIRQFLITPRKDEDDDGEEPAATASPRAPLGDNDEVPF